MKVCIVSRGDLNLFPPTEGGSVKIYSTIKFLSLLGVKVFFVSAENDCYFVVEKGVFRRKKYPKWLAKDCSRKIINKVLSLLGLTPDIFVLYHPLLNIKLWLKTLFVVIKEKVDVLQAEFTAFAVPVLFTKFLTGVPVCLVEHNVETFQLPKASNITERGKKVVKIIEKIVCKLADRVIAITKEDKRRLKKLRIRKNKIYVIPHGVDLDAFKNANCKRIRKKYKLNTLTLIFHGTYSYKPNYEAIKILAEKILPRLEKTGVKVKLLAVGNHPPKDIKTPNIIFTGPVKNLPDYIDAADIAVVPILAGGGMRMKILEYFAAKKPVISTRSGAEGIKVRNGKEIILSSINNFPREIIRLAKFKKLREKLIENAFKLVQEYDWRKICQKYIKVYGELKS